MKLNEKDRQSHGRLKMTIPTKLGQMQLIFSLFLDYSKKVSIPKLTICFVSMFLAIIFGYAATILPATWLVAFGVAIVGGLLSIFSPPIAACAVLVFSFGLIPFASLDYRVLSELSIYGSLIIVSLWSIQKEKDYLEHVKYYKAPLLLFLAAWCVALFSGLTSNFAFANADARRYVGFLAILLFSVIEVRRKGTCLRVLLGISIIASGMLIVQMLTGWRVFGGASGYWESVSKELEGVTRGTSSGGDYLIAFSFYYCLIKASKTSKSLYLIGAAFFLLAIASTFSRGLWAGCFVGAISIAYFYRNESRELLKIFGFGILGVAILGSAIYSVRPKIVEAVVVRTLSVSEEGQKGTSLGARLDENQQALEAAKKYWLLGMGHGAEYKKYLNRSDVGFANQITFIHNSYLWVIVKLGLIGVISVGLLVYKVLHRAKTARIHSGEFRYIGVSGAATVMIYLVTGITSPVWGQSPDLVAFSLLAVCLASAAHSANSMAKEKN